MVFRVRPDFPRPPHKPGQYSTLGLGNWEPRFPGCQEEDLKPGDEQKLVRRAYSISSSVLDDNGQLFDMERTDWLEFYIVLVRESDRTARQPRLRISPCHALESSPVWKAISFGDSHARRPDTYRWTGRDSR